MELQIKNSELRMCITFSINPFTFIVTCHVMDEIASKMSEIEECSPVTDRYVNYIF